MLTWQEDSPRFVVGGHVGDKLTLYFGLTNIDDIELPEFYFVAKLVQYNQGWSLEARLRGTETDPPGRKPRVGTFTSKLQLAIETGGELDFRKYLAHWSRQFREFSIVVTDTALSQAVPARIWPGQRAQEDGEQGGKKRGWQR